MHLPIGGQNSKMKQAVWDKLAATCEVALMAGARFPPPNGHDQKLPHPLMSQKDEKIVANLFRSRCQSIRATELR